MTPSTIQVQFNGKSIELEPPTNIVELLELAEIRSQLVAVEVNGEIVPREQHAEHQLANGDIIEAVTLVGGG
jgi:sulfur carrier protein